MKNISQVKTLTDQTQAIIQMEINQVLEEYPYCPYQEYFASPDRRQELADYILRHVSKLYTSIDPVASHLCGNNHCVVPHPSLFPTAVGLTIEILIHQGIQEILHQNTRIDKPTNGIYSMRMVAS